MSGFSTLREHLVDRPEWPVDDLLALLDQIELEEAAPRFWARVEDTGGCRLWRGATSKGYPLFRFPGGSRGHLFAWLLGGGKRPEPGQIIRRSCGQLLCVSFEHLFLADHADAIREGVERRWSDYVPSPEQFWRNVDQSADGCWEWQLGCTRAGYGEVTYGGRQYFAHRLAFELATGQEPGEKFVLHTCDNPPCVRPDHLYLGDQKDNMRDREERGRWTAPRGSENPQSQLIEEDVREIRRLYASGDWSYLRLGEKFSVSGACIGAIVRRRTWRWLDP